MSEASSMPSLAAAVTGYFVTLARLAAERRSA
jgi:hypothetical protein